MGNKNNKSEKEDPGIDDNSDSSVGKKEVSGGNASESASSKEHRSSLNEVPDGAGCTEIWEHLSNGRDGGSSEE